MVSIPRYFMPPADHFFLFLKMVDSLQFPLTPGIIIVVSREI